MQPSCYIQLEAIDLSCHLSENHFAGLKHFYSYNIKKLNNKYLFTLLSPFLVLNFFEISYNRLTKSSFFERL